MGQACGRSSDEALDLVITNAVVIDWTGIYKVTRRFRGRIRTLIGLCRRTSALNAASSQA